MEKNRTEKGGGGSKRTLKKGYSIGAYEIKWGLFFISPWIIGFLLFNLIPMVSSFGFTLLDYNLGNPDETTFIGFGNWYKALFVDREVFLSIGRVFAFGLISIPMTLIFALSMAILLNSKHLIGKKLFRTLFYLPAIVPLVAAILIFNAVLNNQTGWVNIALEKIFHIKAIGEDGIRWLDDKRLVYFAYAFIGLWGMGNTMLIFLAGLQQVPTELYEASLVDGAGWWKRLTKITIPMLTPVIFYNLTISFIVLMQYFIVPYVLNTSQARPSDYPDGMANFAMVHFYKNSFTYFDMGYGATIAWIMFIVCLTLTAFLFWSSKKWVYYAGEGK